MSSKPFLAVKEETRVGAEDLHSYKYFYAKDFQKQQSWDTSTKEKVQMQLPTSVPAIKLIRLWPFSSDYFCVFKDESSQAKKNTQNAYT